MADGPRTHHDHDHALNVATELHAAGDSARALELLPDLVAARPDDLAVRLLLARCLTTAGSPAVALAAAEAAVACDPTSWEAQALLSRAALVTDPDAAAIAAERAVMLAPGEPDAIRAQVAVRTAQASAPEAEGGSRRATAGLAALGLRPAPAAPARPELREPEPRLTPRLPAALDPLLTSPPPPAGAPADLVARTDAEDALTEAPIGSPEPAPAPPPSLAKTPPPVGPPTVPDAPTVTPAAPASRATPQTPAVDPSVLAAAEEARGRREAPLPVSLGGTGLGGAEPTADDAKPVGGARMAIRVLGLATWVFLGFRIGLQGVGGPAGIGLLLLTVASAAYGARHLRSL